jgi:hypothetical protein
MRRQELLSQLTSALLLTSRAPTTETPGKLLLSLPPPMLHLPSLTPPHS